MKRFRCEPCGYTTHDKSNFHRHKHGRRHRYRLVGLPPFKTVHPCEVCDRVFRRSDHYRAHLRTARHRRNTAHAVTVREADGGRSVISARRDGEWV